MLNLPEPTFSIPHWPDRIVKDWHKKAQQVASASTGAQGGFAVQALRCRLVELADGGKHDILHKELARNKVARRLLAQLWLEDTNFRDRTLSVATLRVLINQTGPISASVLVRLLNLYFREFDQLVPSASDRRTFNELTSMLRNEVQEKPRAKKKSNDIISIVAKHKDLLLGIDAPANLVKKTKTSKKTLADFLKKENLDRIVTGRFRTLCFAIYYIERLKEIPIGQSDPVLGELLDESISTAPFSKSKRVGHRALEVLIDRCGNEQPSDCWLAFILDMAGDPRVVNGRAFADWWQPLGQERVARVRGWLSKLDIKVFLEALDDISKAYGKEDMRRMLPARKRFIEGLSDAGWLRQSRLALGHEIAAGVRRRLGSVAGRIHFMGYDKSDTAILILDCGDFIIVEGSHSFRVWVYLANPAGNVLFDYGVAEIDHQGLIHRLPAAYKKEYPGLPYEAVRHHPNIRWQYDVLCFLAKHGIWVDPEFVLDSSDYSVMTRNPRYGMPVLTRTKLQVPEPKPLMERVFQG